MEKYIFLIGFLLLLSSAMFLSLTNGVTPGYLAPYLFASILVLVSGGIFLATARKTKTSYFICGECEKIFLSEFDLRDHYKEHSKKSEKK